MPASVCVFLCVCVRERNSEIVSVCKYVPERKTKCMHISVCGCVFEPGPLSWERPSPVPSLSLMRLDELALRDMIWTAVAAPQHPPPPFLALPPLLIFVLLSFSSPCSFFSLKQWQASGGQKNARSNPAALAFMHAATALYHSPTHTHHTHRCAHKHIQRNLCNLHRMKHFRLPHQSFSTHSHTRSLPCTSLRIQLQLMLLQLSTWEVLGFL